MRRDSTFLRRIDPQTVELVEVARAPETSGGSVIEAFGSIWATAYNDSVLYRVRPLRDGYGASVGDGPVSAGSSSPRPVQ